MSADSPCGLLVIDKPAGSTSHDVVRAVRNLLAARAGHAGTLDPQATGVLLVCIGAATRLAKFLQGHDKVYEGVIRLGWATDTYDADGEPVAEPVAPPRLCEEEVAVALQDFVGEIEQIPPVYSAKKVRGEPSYRRARRGEQVDPDPVSVVVHSVRLLGLERERIHLRIFCGSGTYVRTLAHDLGASLGCPAHLEDLRRVSSGPFGLDLAVRWSELECMGREEALGRMVGAAQMLPEWPAVVVTREGLERISHGGALEPRLIVERLSGSHGGGGHASPSEAQWVRVLSPAGDMLAAAELLPGGVLQPRVVLA